MKKNKKKIVIIKGIHNIEPNKETGAEIIIPKGVELHIESK